MKAMFFKNLFRKENKVSSKLNFSAQQLNNVLVDNRKSLAEIATWVDEDAMKTSCFDYGVPDFIKIELDKPLNNEATYSDYMLFIARNYLERISYLEIGVSVGKNFFQILNGISNANIVGFDIEDIYPVIENKLNLLSRTEWDGPKESIKKTVSSLSEYTFKDNKVSYLSGDVWDENSWSKLQGRKFNMVFSDALHTPEAILFEFEMLVKYDLLDRKFVIVWDDLVGEMKNSFFQIINKYNDKYGIKSRYLLEVNGWVGQFEGKHAVGIISNFAFE
ncbi:MAG TPA: class I SAM-dependent methyltransferase [Hymenobacter sp.]|jgi:hypothetical protein|uniref:class I SAM-dependent methyltransferase n=1 Tax=Hymenobacter sp. TaxID=1898978 RepID=UPI002EDA98AD